MSFRYREKSPHIRSAGCSRGSGQLEFVTRVVSGLHSLGLRGIPSPCLLVADGFEIPRRHRVPRGDGPAGEVLSGEVATVHPITRKGCVDQRNQIAIIDAPFDEPDADGLLGMVAHGWARDRTDKVVPAAAEKFKRLRHVV